MKFVISTQYLENYGAHCEDGKFSSGNAYWKMKGGSDYIVSDLFPTAYRTFDEWQDELAEESDDYREFLEGCAKEVSPLSLAA